MLDQAGNRTATVTVDEVRSDGGALSARVKVITKAGHKFPSGVAFRRAFIEFSVLDAQDRVLWSSGRTNAAGVIVDASGTPIAGELWWRPTARRASSRWRACTSRTSRSSRGRTRRRSTRS